MKNNIFLKYLDAIKPIISSPEFIKYKKAFNKFQKIILIGNGGSNSIASHISQDMTKFYNNKSLSFLDSSMISCFINYFGMSNAYVKFLNFYADKKTLVILISSGGESKNIVNSVRFLEKKNISYGVLTGFKKNNKVRMMSKKALFNYHVDSKSYGVVECTHQIFLHGII